MDYGLNIIHVLQVLLVFFGALLIPLAAKPVNYDVEYFKHGISKRSPTNPFKTLLCPIAKPLMIKSTLVGGMIGTKIGLPIGTIINPLATPKRFIYIPKAFLKAKTFGKMIATVFCALG